MKKEKNAKKLFLKDTHEWVASIYNYDEFSFNEDLVDVEDCDNLIEVEDDV